MFLKFVMCTKVYIGHCCTVYNSRLQKISIPRGQVSEIPLFQRTWAETSLNFDTGLRNYNICNEQKRVKTCDVCGFSLVEITENLL